MALCAANLAMVTLALAGEEPWRVSCEGCTLQVVPEGRPEQVKETVPEKPRPGPGLTRSVVVPGAEAETVTFPGLTAIWKSGLPIKRMLGGDVEPLKFASPE
jgi:hypothetical protein